MQVGDVYNTTRDGKVEVIGYINSKNVRVRFIATGNVQVNQSYNIKEGAIRDVGELKRKKEEKLAKSEAYAKKLKEVAEKREARKAAIALKTKLREDERVAQQKRKEERELRRVASLDTTIDIIPYVTKQRSTRKGVIEIDFKDREGNWVLQWRDPITHDLIFSRLGKLYNNVTQRCREGGSLQKCSPTYLGVTLAQEFKNPQKFCDWVVRQKGWEEGYSLDKDLIVKYNRTYGPDTCVLLPAIINTSLAHRLKSSGVRKIGGKWRAISSMRGREVNLGEFPLKGEAERAYQNFSKKFLRALADYYRPTIEDRAYQRLLDISDLNL